MIVFSVKNSVSPGCGVTNESLDELVLRAQSPDSQKTKKTKEDSHKTSHVRLTKDATSTSAGLPHIHLVCQGAGGSFNLALDEHGDVVCSILLPAQLIPRSKKTSVPAVDQSPAPEPDNLAASNRIHHSTMRPSLPSLITRMPAGCKMLVIDDSKVKEVVHKPCVLIQSLLCAFGSLDLVQRILQDPSTFARCRQRNVTSLLPNLQERS